MFNFFENIVPPFPEEEIEQPPAKLSHFVWHYTRPFRFLLLALFFTSAIIAGIEVYMFNAIGELIDWMQVSDPSTFMQEYGSRLGWAILVILVVWPLLHLVDSLVEHQGLLGNFAMQIRWRAHRYLLRQSLGFFQDDFAGRVATKMMQTALGVRDAVLKITELLIYVGV